MRQNDDDRPRFEPLGVLKAVTNSFSRGRTQDAVPRPWLIRTILAPVRQAPAPTPVQAVAAAPAPATVPEPAIAPVGTGPSIIAVNVDITGSINSPDTLHVFGTVEGSVRAAAVTVFPSGVVVGDVVAETVLVKGTVEGRIYGQTVQLCAGAAVRGDVFYASLGIDPAATFDGLAKRLQNPLAEAPAPAKPVKPN